MKKQRFSRAIEHPLFRRYNWMCYEHKNKGTDLEWSSFWHFAEDIEDHLGIPPNVDEMFLLRKDQTRGYTLKNLFWGTRIEQGARLVRTNMLTYKRKTLSLKQWSIELGVPYGTLYSRLRYGWPVRDILTV
jgi:hypothetical protein